MLTLTEVLVHPLLRRDRELVGRYRRILLNASHMTTLPVSEVIAEEAARLRANYSLRTPDAIQLATAIRSGASSFLTNDSKLPSLPCLNLLTLNRLIAITP